MTIREGAAGARLEVRLERLGLVGIVEPNPDLAFPRTELVGRGGSARVVLGEPTLEVPGETDVLAIRILLASDQVDSHHPPRSSAEAERRGVPVSAKADKPRSMNQPDTATLLRQGFGGQAAADKRPSSNHFWRQQRAPRLSLECEGPLFRSTANTPAEEP